LAGVAVRTRRSWPSANIGECSPKQKAESVTSCAVGACGLGRPQWMAIPKVLRMAVPPEVSVADAEIGVPTVAVARSIGHTAFELTT